MAIIKVLKTGARHSPLSYLLVHTYSKAFFVKRIVNATNLNFHVEVAQYFITQFPIYKNINF